MTTPLEHLKSRIRNRSGKNIAKGEVWMGTGLFKGPDQDTVENHLRLADELGHSLVCLPVLAKGSVKPDLGYRYFSLADLETAARTWDGPVLAVIDGPFQEMVNTLGMFETLSLWTQGFEAVEEAYHTFLTVARDLAQKVADLPVDGVVFTDDLAGEAGPMVRPKDLDTLCTPFYSKIMAGFKEKQKTVLLHSCGQLDALIPMLASWQLEGLAAIQSRINDFSSLPHKFDTDMVILGGIEVEDLQADSLDTGCMDRFTSLIRDTGQNNLVLGTSCGLYQADFLDRLKQIYEAAGN